MIVKERKTPLILKKLEALLRRLPSNHPARYKIESDFMKMKAGFTGEKKIDFYLELLPKDEFSILHNIRLKNEENHFFQIDTLLLTCNYILILEVKNILGNIIFEKDFNQFIRIHDDKEENFPNPILQVNRQQKHLQTFLQKLKLVVPPIYSFILISNSSSVIKTTLRNNKILENVFHTELLPLKVQKLNEIVEKQSLSSNQIKKISKALLKYHVSLNPNVF
ncbi:hypothetical protein CN692_04800 [Bacillus sp. AFS002410]|uniref:nuclease-related domain-containing protein n=1 Tax=Bacillus sp. AFS002410 TaxID=2033481 RepID=UPI000BF24C05|nr:nuclease-related domain-containing protein [Bacillus sp. AFS002410]PEJ59515.1 hypothetical protein CN692_04800 [Bacillus sp. AFS002410]